ncbi:MAG TPA: hypothetical protein VFE47_02935 [Tepidisphaeraceae bacterium]|jgi:hypothetical protein|nr:hypothetical protein [Tepidisphaeraceae bacterium]
MSVIQVGLVDKGSGLDPSLVQAAAAALNIQVMRDLPQYWNVSATVRYLPDPKKIPVGVWPVFLVPRLPPGEGGVHLDKKNQPYSLVIGTPGNNDWTIDASHETIEMLVDPSGNRMQTSRAIEIEGNGVQDAVGEFGYLVEACDPCEANQYAYSIQGIAVSDFITPHFYDPVATSGTRYSFGGNIQRPRQILPGGYISFTNPSANDWEQILWLGARPQLRNLGPASGASLRVWIDWQTHPLTTKNRKHNKKLADHCKAHRAIVEQAATVRAKMYEF